MVGVMSILCGVLLVGGFSVWLGNAGYWDIHGRKKAARDARATRELLATPPKRKRLCPNCLHSEVTSWGIRFHCGHCGSWYDAAGRAM
jgi:uncharacterized protein CbrC (UPF0167 family)